MTLKSTARTKGGTHSASACVDQRAASATAVQQPVLSLLAAGLPLPKSPSMQMAELACGGSEQQEREERGWWSKRFHEVFAELSVQEVAVAS